MKINLIFNLVRCDRVLNLKSQRPLSSKLHQIHYRSFTTTAEHNSSVDQNYFDELLEKSDNLLQKLNVNESELLQNKDVVFYTRNRTCNKCNKTVKISHPELVGNICPDAWRYFHKFSYVQNCPIYGIMKFTKYSKLRTEQKVLIHND